MTDLDRETESSNGDAEAAASDEAARGEAMGPAEADRDRLARFLERLQTSQADPAVTGP